MDSLELVDEQNWPYTQIQMLEPGMQGLRADSSPQALLDMSSPGAFQFELFHENITQNGVSGSWLATECYSNSMFELLLV
jgi:hypothetical protein